MIRFPTCIRKTLDVVFAKDLVVNAQIYEKFESCYNCSDHRPVSFDFYISMRKPKPLHDCYYSYGIIDMFVPQTTRHRQSLPLWYTSNTSNLLKRVETQRRLFKSKPTSYRKQKLSEMEKLLLEKAERDKLEYQYKLFSSRKMNFLLKQFKSMNKNADIPEVLRFGTVEAKTIQQKANLLNEYFQSVYSQPCKISTRQTSEVTEGLVTVFSVSKRIIRSILDETDETKSSGPDGIPPIFFKKLAEPMSCAFNTLFETVKRLKAIPEDWKTGVISPIHKKGSKNAVENNRLITLLNFASKTLERCMNVPLYNHLATLVSNCQHGFIKNRSVLSNLLSYLKLVSETLDVDPTTAILAFYTDFAKAFDKLPHSELLHKLEDMGVGGCFLQVLVDYLTNRKNYLRIGNCSSTKLNMTPSVPQDSILGQVLFCFFNNDLPNAFRNSYTLLFADDLKVVTTTNNHVTIELELKRFQRWNKENQMLLAEGKNGFLEFRGSNSNFKLNTEILEPAEYMKDLGVFICPDLSWNKTCR